MKKLLLAIAFAALGYAAFAQVPPYIHGATVGRSPIQALPTDPLRKKIYFYNPNATALIAFCPIGPNRDTGSPLTCAINGAGSFTLQPYCGLAVVGSNEVERLNLSSAWNVIANTGGSTYTAMDLE